MDQSSEKLDQAAELAPNNPEATSEILEEVREELTEAAEALVEETRPTQSQEETYRLITELTNRMEVLEAIISRKQEADAEAEQARATVELIAETPAPTREQEVAARLKGRPLRAWW